MCWQIHWLEKETNAVCRVGGGYGQEGRYSPSCIPHYDEDKASISDPYCVHNANKTGSINKTMWIHQRDKLSFHL